MRYHVSTLSLIILFSCSQEDRRATKEQLFTQAVSGKHDLTSDDIWLSHEHILVDFIGADSIQSASWDHDSVINQMLPYLEELKKYEVSYFVDATPNYLGRDVVLLNKLAERSGLKIITNTGFYGAFENKYIPGYALDMKAEALAEIWVNEFENGIDGSSIKPGFIKISVDNADPLSPFHQELVKAAALTHLKTGLTIASHTGAALGLWPQLKILKENGVSPEAFIWVHAQAEEDHEAYVKAAQAGCWISLDGLAWDIENHADKLLFAKENQILDRILISHDAGWYDPQKETQDIKPYTGLFEKLYPALKSRGFTDDEFNLLIRVNPAKAFSIKVKEHTSAKSNE